MLQRILRRLGREATRCDQPMPTSMLAPQQETRGDAPAIEVIRCMLGEFGKDMHAEVLSDGTAILRDANLARPVVLSAVSRSKQAVRSLFKQPSVEWPSGLSVVVFGDRERLWATTESLFGVHLGASRGIFMKGQPPLLLVSLLGFDDERSLTHELTHAFLSPLELPRWVDEGLALLAETQVTSRMDITDPAVLARVFAAHDYRSRWLTGDLFDDDDPRFNNAAYSLAYLSASLLHRENAAAFSSDALAECQRGDGGASWLSAHFDVALDALFPSASEESRE